MAAPIRAGIPGKWEGARCRGLRITCPEDDLPFLPDCQDIMLDICNEPEPCPVRARCLLFALVNNCDQGIWGGMSPEDRAALRKTYPLGAGRRTETGVVYDPPAQWRWMPPETALLLLTDTQRKRRGAGETGDDHSKTSWADERAG
jgi:hypothetical protein